MGTRQAKRVRKQVHRLSKEIIKKALTEIREYPLKERFKFCWWVLWKK